MKKGHIALLIGVVTVVAGGIYLYFRLNTFRKKIVHVALAELSKWNILTERSVNASSMLVKYWQSVGMFFSKQQMQDIQIQSDYPWSSAFISYLFFKAGAKNRFPYASSHSGYFQVAKQNRDNKNAPLRGFRISEYVPKVGDLIVYSRQSGKGYDSLGFFPSHGELVIEKGKGFIKAIGGNVSNKVKMSKYTTDSKGFLTTNEAEFFMVIQNNIK